MQLESRQCFSCSAEVDAEDRFCQECGSKLEQSAQANHVRPDQPGAITAVPDVVPEVVQFKSDWSLDFGQVDPTASAGEHRGPEDTLELPESDAVERPVMNVESVVAGTDEIPPRIEDAVAADLAEALSRSARALTPMLDGSVIPDPEFAQSVAPTQPGELVEVSPALSAEPASINAKDIQLPFAKPGQVIFKNGELILIDTPDAHTESGGGLHSPLLSPDAILNVVRVKHAGQGVIDKRANKKVKRGFRIAVGQEPLILSMMLLYAVGLLSWIHTEHPEVVYVQTEATEPKVESPQTSSVAEYNRLLADYFARKSNSTVVEGQQIAQRQLTGEEPAPQPPSYDEWVTKNKPVF